MPRQTNKDAVKRTNNVDTNGVAREKHLAGGGDLLLVLTQDRIQRTTRRVVRAKRIDDAFAASKQVALNWRAPMNKSI